MVSRREHSLTIPVEFSGQAQLILFTRYGDPRSEGWENRWLTHWEIAKEFPWFPSQKICVHKHFRPILEDAFKALMLHDLHTEILTCDDAYNVRMIRGSKNVLSTHSWGAALDLNCQENPLGSTGAWTEDFIRILEEHQICCGQSWSGRKDPMHFAMVNG